MSTSELQVRIEQAFTAGLNQQGLELLRELNSGEGSSAQSLHRQAVIEEQIGDWQLAGQAHRKCVEMAPQIAVAYLYAGSWLLKNGNNAGAAALFSLAQEADPDIFNANAIAKSQVETAARLKSAQSHLVKFLSQQHKNHTRQLNCTSRVQNSVWVQTQDSAITLPPNYSPQLFFVPELTQLEFHDAAQFDWTVTALDLTEQIKEELSSALLDHQGELGIRPYLDGQLSDSTGLAELAGSLNWSAIDVFRDGKINTATAPLFPRTLELINATPCYQLDDKPFEVFFSVLKAGQKIAPHFGLSNHSLTVHLALDIPDNCYLEVNTKRSLWSENKLMVFDDNFLHAAYNNSDSDRVVLIFSVWHPDLSLEERSALQSIFDHRRHWMQSRTSHLADLP